MLRLSVLGKTGVLGVQGNAAMLPQDRLGTTTDLARHTYSHDRFGDVMNRIQSIMTGGKGALLQADMPDLLPFAGLTEAQREDMMRLAKVNHVARHDAFFEEGDSAENFYVLIDGFLRVGRTTPDGDQVVMLHVVPGQMFGIASGYGSARHTMAARAITDAVALSWPSVLWDKFMQDYPGFQDVAHRAVSIRMKDLEDRVTSLATARVEQRIAEAVLRLMREAGKETVDGIEIAFPISRQDISEMTGTTLHSVSRCMSGWQKRGIVRSGRCRVVICDPEALSA